MASMRNCDGGKKIFQVSSCSLDSRWQTEVEALMWKRNKWFL